MHFITTRNILKSNHLPLIFFMSVLVFFFHLILTTLFANKLVYLQWDVLFGSDTHTYVGIFGQGWGGRGFRHPNISNMINPPIRLFSYGLDFLGLSNDPSAAVRNKIALIIVPIASAIKIFVFGLILRVLGANKSQLIIGVIVATLSFSQVIFGTIPESFGISGMALATAFLLLAIDVRFNDRITWWAWFFLGVFSLGITITNIALVGILFLTLLLFQKRTIRFIFITSSLLCVAILIATLAIHVVMNNIYDVKQLDFLNGSQAKNSYTKYARPNMIDNMKMYPHAIIDSIAPEKPVLRNLGYETQHLYKQVVTFKKYRERDDLSQISVILLIYLLFSCIYSWQGSKVLKAMITGSISILIYNCIFHSLWGSRELFLYSQHWHIALVIILVAPTFVDTKQKTLSIIVGAIMLIISTNNVLRIQQVFDLLNNTL